MLNKKTLCFISFAIGVAAGALGTWKYVEQKYAKIADDEIASVKAVLGKRVKVETVDETPAESPKDIYKNIIADNGYTQYSERTDKKVMDKKRPYVIPPEQFGDNEDYEQISLTYYADKVLTDEDNEVIEDVDDVVGLESLNHFGEYEDDSVFIRNDKRKCDYEILLDQRLYTDVCWEV